MIVGFLSNVKEEWKLYPAFLQSGLKYLSQTDLAGLPLGRTEVETDKIFALVSEYETEPEEKRRPEAHRQYIDIQYVVSGEEKIVAGPLAAAGEIAQPYSAAKDIEFYQALKQETDIVLTPGMFAVFFPWDVHKPNCNTGKLPVRVRKVVLKIAAGACTAP